MNEPDNLMLVMVGNLTDQKPWDIEIWARADEAAFASTAHWYRLGGGDSNVERASWDWLQDHARYLGGLRVLGTGA